MAYSLIFDMDGTLFQTNTILELALENTFSQLRKMELWDRESPIDIYRKIMGAPLQEEELAQADMIINHFSELPNLLEELTFK
uniref:hypothetical protein n=1 Tax=Paenibacillus senegalensis TaxID=1465766 RepID=UPI000287C4DD|nr:hypothetical protein [Paenibacillus senegalensis]